MSYRSVLGKRPREYFPFLVVVSQVKENSVLLASDDRVTVAHRIGGFRHKRKAARLSRLGRPVYGGSGLHEVTAEALVFVHDRLRVDNAAPLDVERHGSGNRSNGWDVQTISREPLSTGEVIEQIVSVHYGDIVDPHRPGTFIKIGVDRIVRGWDYPEKPIGRDSRAVIVNL